MKTKKHPMDDNYRYLGLSVFDGGGAGADSNNADDNGHTVLVVTLNRPRKHNALNAAMWKEIGVLFRKIGVSPAFSPCRCVLLLGNGPSFCAGIDVTDASFLSPFSTNGNGNGSSDDKTKMDPARAGLAFEYKLRDMQQAFTEIEECPVPVVAAMHGNVVGGAIDLMTATQVRLCVVDTKFAVKEVALGLAADVGTLQRLPKVVNNQSLVHELCYTGRTFTAQEALQMGLVSRIVATREELYRDAMQLCCKIAQFSPLAIHGTKRSLLYSRDHSVKEGLDHIAAYNRLALQAPDVQTAFLSAVTKERATFGDIPPRARL